MFLYDNVIMDILPNDIIDIIYRYIHRLNSSQVFEELWDQFKKIHLCYGLEPFHLRKCIGCKSWQLSAYPSYLNSKFVCERCILSGYLRPLYKIDVT